MHVMTVVGARPQFVKAAPVSRALQRAGIRETLVHTGQHYDVRMSDIFFEQLGLPAPAHHLDVGSMSHGAQTGRIMERLEPVLQSAAPDWLLVYGDTNSTLGGALVAAKLHVPVAHVEAGLRSFDRRMPEEVNRVLTDHVSTRLYVPTPTAAANLAAEGIRGPTVRCVGDVMLDAVRLFGSLPATAPSATVALGVVPRSFALVTIHRAENTDDPARLAAIMDGMDRLAREVPVIWPVHPRLAARLAGRPVPSGMHRVEPFSYFDMLRAQRDAAVVVTDSGGLQKEAFFAGVPCVTLRDTTEWVETVTLGWNRLVPPQDGATIAQAARDAIGTRGETAMPYGDGRAAEVIAADLLERP